MFSVLLLSLTQDSRAIRSFGDLTLFLLPGWPLFLSRVQPPFQVFLLIFMLPSLAVKPKCVQLRGQGLLVHNLENLPQSMRMCSDASFLSAVDPLATWCVCSVHTGSTLSEFLLTFYCSLPLPSDFTWSCCVGTLLFSTA